MFWADAHGGKETFVELMYASVEEYYGGARYSEEGKPCGRDQSGLTRGEDPGRGPP